MMTDLLGQLETSYATRKGYWKGGTVGVFGYGGGIIPRFTELKDESGKPLFPEAAEFHTLRVQPPAGMHYSSNLLRKLCDVWLEAGGSGLIAFHASGCVRRTPTLKQRTVARPPSQCVPESLLPQPPNRTHFEDSTNTAVTCRNTGPIASPYPR